MTSEACQHPGLSEVSLSISLLQKTVGWFSSDKSHLWDGDTRSDTEEILPAYQTLEPKPQIGKSFEASVKVVPRIGLSDILGFRHWESLTKR